MILGEVKAIDSYCKHGVSHLVSTEYHLIIDELKSGYKRMTKEQFTEKILKVIDLNEIELQEAITKMTKSNPRFSLYEIRYALILKSSYCY